MTGRNCGQTRHFSATLLFEKGVCYTSVVREPNSGGQLKLVTADQMRQIEQRAAAIGLPANVLMENAGLALAREIKKFLGGLLGKSILVLVGPGNNGGDGLVAARHLCDWGSEVLLCIPRARQESDDNYRLVKLRGIREIHCGEGETTLGPTLRSVDAVIDAFFGTGKARPLGGVYKDVLLKLKEAKELNPQLRILAADVPSGMDADTGNVDEGCPVADATIALGYPKRGLFVFPGASKVGELFVADIGIPPELGEDVSVEVITERKVRRIVPPRPLDAHKGTFGRVLVVGGSLNYIGAVSLSSEAAIRAGAGLVTMAVPSSIHTLVAGKVAEVTYQLLPEARPGVVAPEAADEVARLSLDSQSLLLGCGMGRTPEALDFLKSLLHREGLAPLILDADGLNLLSEIPEWWNVLTTDAVLTPHPREMSRLTGLSVRDIQTDRIGVAGEAAARWKKTVVLKGANTVVAEHSGSVFVAPWANPALASAGTGDVLAGIIAGLVAQGLKPAEAALLGVYVHGEAAELGRARLGGSGMAASDLFPLIPLVTKRLRTVHSQALR